jgi:hypothetical protein
MSQDDWNDGFIVGVVAGDAPRSGGGGGGTPYQILSFISLVEIEATYEIISFS